MMKFLDFFKQTKKNTACIAKERLQIIVAQRRSSKQIDFLPALQREILEVIKKYVNVNEESVRVELERSGDCSVLELNITLPEDETTTA
jgi:cell division topological specificity factor